MSKRKGYSTVKGEKFLLFLVGLFVILNIFGRSFSMAMLSKTNIEVESIRKKINTQENLNESLGMKINELASLDNIGNVATLYGLGYNNDNIKVIDK
ncbi:MAG: hypothetical protein RSB41_02485 [Bacilli bacterium]